MLVTPLQLANAYATLVNGGTVYSPNIAREVRAPSSDEVVRTIDARPLSTVELPAQIRQPILDGLIGALNQPGGTAFGTFQSFPEGFTLGGKTGTAETPGDERADNALFVAFGPMQSPQYVVVAVLEESGFGGVAAALVGATAVRAADQSGAEADRAARRGHQLTPPCGRRSLRRRRRDGLMLSLSLRSPRLPNGPSRCLRQRPDRDNYPDDASIWVVISLEVRSAPHPQRLRRPGRSNAGCGRPWYRPHSFAALPAFGRPWADGYRGASGPVDPAQSDCELAPEPGRGVAAPRRRAAIGAVIAVAALGVLMVYSATRGPGRNEPFDTTS